MAHELSIRENGLVEFAFTGSRNKIWHGLGQEVPDDISIDEWKIKAGLDWEVFESAITYNAYGEDLKFPSRKALFPCL